MPFSNTQEILNYVLTEAYEPTSSASEFRAHTLDHLNRALLSISAGGTEFDENINETWWWLLSEGQIFMKQFEDIPETVALTINSSAGVFSSSPNSSYANFHIRLAGNRDVYKILSHTANTPDFTLEHAYAGPTVTAADAEVFKIDYSGVEFGVNLTQEMTVKRNGKPISYVSRETLQHDWPISRIQSGEPSKFTVLATDSANKTATIRFNKFWKVDSGTEDLLIEYGYIQEPPTLTDDSSSIPIIPVNYRHVLADAAIYFLLETKEDSKAQRVLPRVVSGIRAMSKEHRARLAKSGRVGQILPRQSRTHKNIDNILRTESGLIIGS